jgi:hypothetical protein
MAETRALSEGCHKRVSWLPATLLPASRSDRVAIGSIVAGSLLRVVWILLAHPPTDYVFSDMQGYVQRARAGRGYQARAL